MGQITVFSGPERRRRWSDEQRLRILTKAFAPGACASDAARRHEISTGLLYTWRKKLAAQAASVADDLPCTGFAEAIVSSFFTIFVPRLRRQPAVEARRGYHRDAGGDPAHVEGDPDRAREVRLPGLRDDHPITQPPAPFHVVPRGWAGPSFLDMLLFDKYGQHQPLNRQADGFAREGVPLSISTLADQVGAVAFALMPIHRLIEAHILERCAIKPALL